jgi:hypothetical protein
MPSGNGALSPGQEATDAWMAVDCARTAYGSAQAGALSAAQSAEPASAGRAAVNVTASALALKLSRTGTTNDYSINHATSQHAEREATPMTTDGIPVAVQDVYFLTLPG